MQSGAQTGHDGQETIIHVKFTVLHMIHGSEVWCGVKAGVRFDGGTLFPLFLCYFLMIVGRFALEGLIKLFY